MVLGLGSKVRWFSFVRVGWGRIQDRDAAVRVGWQVFLGSGVVGGWGEGWAAGGSGLGVKMYV